MKCFEVKMKVCGFKHKSKNDIILYGYSETMHMDKSEWMNPNELIVVTKYTM